MTQTPLQRLRALGDRPDDQARHALEMLRRPAAAFDVQGALEVLAGRPDPAYRAPLLELYAHYDADGVRRDPGGSVRAAVLRALRPICEPSDVPLLEDAAMRVEFLPPGPSEVASGLRAGALAALLDADPERAAFHAVRLLRDQYTDRMGGEPAITAARLLGATESPLPLYDYVLAPSGRIPEVTAECLRQLVALPMVLLVELVARYGGEADVVEQVGLVDLVHEHPHGAELAEVAGQWLAAWQDEDLFRYLATVMVTSRRRPFLEAALHAARWEMAPGRTAIWREVLHLARPDPEVQAVASILERRKQP